MSTETRTLEARFDGDTAGLARAVARAERQLRKYDRAADSAGRRGSGTLARGFATARVGAGRFSTGIGFAGKGVGLLAGTAGIAGAAVFGIGSALVSVGDNAVASGLSVAKARNVFGSSFPQMEKWVRSSANAMGLTRIEALGLGAGIQDFLVPMGVARDQAQNMTQRFLKLSGTLALNSNGTMTAADVANVFTSALAGEYDSLQNLGIGINAARVKQVAADLQKKSSRKLTDAQAQALAVLTIAEHDSTDAKKLATTAEGKQAIAVARAKAKLREKWQEIQQRLLPVVLRLWSTIEQKVVPALGKFATFLGSPKGQRQLRVWADKVQDIVSALARLIEQADKAFTVVSKVAKYSGGAGSFLGGALKHLPGFAAGGIVPPHTTAITGEDGPEVITSGARPLTVIPNHQLGGGVGVAEIHIEIGGEVVRVVRAELRADRRATARAVGAGASGGLAA